MAEQAAVSVSPSEAAAGSTVTLVATGFPADADVTISAGPTADEQSLVARGRTDREGRLEASVAVPSPAGRGEILYVVTTADTRVRVASDPIAVADGQERPSGPITVTGRVTDEGVECPAVRGEDGTLYTITGAGRDQLRSGRRVRVTGTVAEISFCMQGITINATRVELLE